MTSEVAVEIAAPLQTHVGVLDVIGPEGTFFFVVEYDHFRPGWLFRVAAKEYFFALSFTGDAIELVRDSHRLRVPIAETDARTGHFIVLVLWATDRLSLRIRDKSGSREDERSFPAVFPPNSLRDWARRKALLPTVDYESPEALFQAVVEQLQHLRDKIVDTNAFAGFWDTHYDGKKIESRTPKRETEIHPQVRLFLYDLELRNSLQVVPEYPIGSGRLDFLISGRTKAGALVHVCVEFKHAHASDLAHGLSTQLPEYMTRRGTDYGIYCVLDFGSDYPADMGQFHIEHFDANQATLDLILPVAASHTGRRNLRTIQFDLARRVPPSKA